MIKRCFLALSLLFFCSPLYAYKFQISWDDYSNSNYGRGQYVATALFLKICESQGVTLSETSQTLLAGFSGNLYATKGSNSISFEPPYSNLHITKNLVLLPIWQNENVIRVAYSMLICGEYKNRYYPASENVRVRFVWTANGTADITNFFTTVDQITIVDDLNYFPYRLSGGSFVYFNPQCTLVDIDFSTTINANILSGQRLKNGTTGEIINQITDINYPFLYSRLSSPVYDFLTDTAYDVSNLPGAFSLLAVVPSSGSASLFNTSNLLQYDFDAGSEPDIHEFFSSHLYTYPEDDWVYSGEDYPSGGGSGSGGQITGYTSDAQSQVTSSVQDAIENYFGDSSTVTTPQMPSTSISEDLADPELDENWLTDARDEVEDVLPDGVSEVKRIINALKNPPSGRLPVFNLPVQTNLGGSFGTIFSGASSQIDFNVLTQPPYYVWLQRLRKIVVFCLFVYTILFIVRDAFCLGGEKSAE